MKHILTLLVIFLIGSARLTAQNSGSVHFELRDMPALPMEDMAVSGFLLGNSWYDLLDGQEKSWFYWTNYSRINPKRFWDSVVQPILEVYPEFNSRYAKSLKVDLYKAGSLPLMKPSQVLMRTAKAHASQLSRTNIISHSSPDGTPFSRRMSNAGIKSCAGENISIGFPNTLLALVLLYIDDGVADVGHRKALLSPIYTELGIGLSRKSNGSVVVVQDFSCSQN